MLDLSDHTDHRKWTQQHLDAADLRIASIAPTPPQGEIENDCMDVNVRGPGVCTFTNMTLFYSDFFLHNNSALCNIKKTLKDFVP